MELLCFENFLNFSGAACNIVLQLLKSSVFRAKKNQVPAGQTSCKSYLINPLYCNAGFPVTVRQWYCVDTPVHQSRASQDVEQCLVMNHLNIKVLLTGSKLITNLKKNAKEPDFFQ